MTSLAKQLQKLAIPGQPTFQQLTSKKRTPSFLFQPEDVADVTIDTVYSLAQNGLEEIISMDRSFVEYEDSLFSDASKTFERTMQTREALEELDKKLNKFLRQLSPYFMLKPAHKCLEWLVRVYRVHCHNADVLMECVLPYYQTVIFARVVQLLPLKDHTLSKWAWLVPVKRSGTPLSKLTLTQHCLSDLSFLVFVCECVPASLKACKHSSSSNSSRMAVSLYTSTLLSVLDSASSITEDLVMRLVPYLKRGLKSGNLEYKASSYMVVSQLAVVMEMEAVLVVNLLELVCKGLVEAMLKEGLCCLAVLCHSQNVPGLSHKSLQYLLTHSGLVATLSSLSHTHNITPLLAQLCSSLWKNCLDSGVEEEEEGLEGEVGGASLGVLEELLDEVQLDQKTALEFVELLLSSGVAVLNSGSEGESEHMKWVKGSLSTLVSSMDAKYPSLMDEALEHTFAAIYSHNVPPRSSDLNAEKRAELLYEVVASSLSPSPRHQMWAELRMSLSTCVHHPISEMRSRAFTKLGEGLQKQIKQEGGDVEKDATVVSAVVAGLADESPGVLLAVMGLGRKLLFKCLPPDQLVSSLVSLLERKTPHRSSSQWQEACLSAVGLLTSKSMSAVPADVLDDAVTVIVPLLFVDGRGSNFAKCVVDKIEGSQMVKGHPVLEVLGSLSSDPDWIRGTSLAVDKDDKDKQLLATVNSLVFSRVAEGVVKLEGGRLQSMLEKLTRKIDYTLPDNHSYFTYLAVIIALFRTTPTSASTQHKLAQQLLQHIADNLQVLEEGGAGDVAVLDNKLAAGFAPLVTEVIGGKATARQIFFIVALQALCDCVVVPQDLSSSMWLDPSKISSQEQMYYDLLVSLFSQLTFLVDSQPPAKGSTSGRLLLQSFFKRYLSGCGVLLRFLAMIWTALPGTKLVGGASVDPMLQGCSLGIGCAYVMALDNRAAVALVTDHCPVVPSLLVPLASPHQLVRERAMECLFALQQACSHTHPLPETDSDSGTAIPSMLSLVHGITKARSEVIMDHTHITEVLRRRHDSAVPAALPPTPSKRRSKRLASAAGMAKATPTAVENGVTPETWLEGVVMHVVGLGMPSNIQNQVLKIIQGVEDSKKLVALVPLLCAIMDELLGKQCTDPGDTALKGLSAEVQCTLTLLVQCFTPAVATSFTDQPHLLRIFLQLLKTDTPLGHASPMSSPQMLAIKQLSPRFFAALSGCGHQLEVLCCLLDVLVGTDSSHIAIAVKDTMGKCPLTVELVCEVLLKDLEDMGEAGVVKEAIQPTPKKKRRGTRATDPNPPPDSAPLPTSDTAIDGRDEVGRVWRRVAVVLELLENSSFNLPEPHPLVPVLFKCLTRVLELEERERQCLEYLQQLLLSCLHSITQHYASLDASDDKEVLTEREFNVEQVVQCIRLSASPQTHHHALLLLTSAATLFPTLVLHSVMPIFTFMGAQLLHQDDLYSFQVITKTIDTVIPTLIKSGALLPKTPSKRSLPKKRPSVAAGSSSSTQPTVEEMVTEIIRIFVDALPHIPDHRKLPLFGHLLGTMGPQTYLHLALGVMLEKTIGPTHSQDQQEPVIAEEARLEPSLIVGVAQQFLPTDQILAFGKLAEYLSHLPEEKPNTPSKLRQLSPSVSAIFNVATHTNQELQTFKLSSLSLLSTLLSHPNFLTQVESFKDGSVEDEVLNILRVMLKYCSRLSSSEVGGGRGGAKKGSMEHKCLKKSYMVLDKVTSLLTPASFLDVMMQLVGVESEKEKGNSSLEVQRRALDILAGSLEGRRLKFRKSNMNALLNLGKVCADVGVTSNAPIHSRQTALKCLRLICGKVNASHSNQIRKLSEPVLDFLSGAGEDVPVGVCGEGVQCVPVLCEVLGVQLIPLLPRLLLVSSHYLDLDTCANKRSVKVVVGALTALQAVVKTLPNFLSASYTTDVVAKLCGFADVSASHDRSKLEDAAADVRTEISGKVPVKNLLTAYSKCYHKVAQSGKDCVLALLGMLHATVDRLTKEDIGVHEDLLCETLISSLDYRATHTEDEASLSSVGAVEKSCVEVGVALSVRLTEPQFRQLLLQLLDWATSSSAPRLRLISFYHFASKAADKLKNLFLLFAGHFFSNAVALLDRTHSLKEGPRVFSEEEGGGDLDVHHCCLLVEHVLQCLSRCFQYDRTEFVSRDRFEALLLPLVNQVTNMVGGKGQYNKRVESLVAECVAHLAVALGKDDLWQKLNYQLLLKTRHKKRYVRCGTLKVLKQFYSKLGEEFEVLVPQTVPFLTELLEDDSEEVEALAQEILGNRV